MTDWADPTIDEGSSRASWAAGASGRRRPDVDGVLTEVDPSEPQPSRAGPDGAGAFGLDPALNPEQQAVVALFDARVQGAQQFDAGLRHELRAELEHGLAPLLDAIAPDDTLFFSKYPLGQVHGCEVRFLADRGQEFAWTVPSARGTIAHKAVELSIHWKGEAAPLFLVDEAMARLAQGTGSLADFLQVASSVELAELRAEVNERVAKFLESFPPLKPQWRPVTESPVRVELFDRRITLLGKVDLTLGHARGTTARKVLIDFKSGGFSPVHVDDLRFYALLETIRIGTPPRQVATYYLDAGRAHPEVVTEGLLEAAIERTIDGATRMVELEHGGHEPRKRTGPSCRWCPVLADCAEGRAWIEQTDDIELVSGDGL